MEFKNIKNKGMTLPELILAVLMLTAFTGLTVMVTKFTSRFFSQKEGDLVGDFAKINYIFDSIEGIISEAGIDKSKILQFEENCTATPSQDWDIPSIDDETLPISYEICLKSTPLKESDLSELVDEENESFPGIYILYSKIKNEQNINTIPVRRIFCRPKPFCKL